MDILVQLRESDFSQWMSLSMAGFPVLIALHSVGMAVVVGLSLMVTIRLRGGLSDIRARLIPRFLGVAIAGFILNLITGIALFITRGPEYLASGMFLTKMLLVAIAAGILFWLRRRLSDPGRATEVRVFDRVSRNMSLLSTVIFFAAVVAGRLIAYLSDLY